MRRKEGGERGSGRVWPGSRGPSRAPGSERQRNRREGERGGGAGAVCPWCRAPWRAATGWRGSARGRAAGFGYWDGWPEVGHNGPRGCFRRGWMAFAPLTKTSSNQRPRIGIPPYRRKPRPHPPASPPWPPPVSANLDPPPAATPAYKHQLTILIRATAPRQHLTPSCDSRPRIGLHGCRRLPREPSSSPSRHALLLTQANHQRMRFYLIM